MWVVKLGGSLDRDPALRTWLAMLAECGGGRIAIVPGGGRFADAARAAQAHWGVDDVAAHNMAVLGMAQTAQLMKGLNPALECADSAAAVREVLRRGELAVWMPFELLRGAADALTSWEVSADSLALWLAGELGAARVVLVKSCAVPPRAGADELAARGIVDRRFPAFARAAACRIDVLGRDAVDRLRGELLATARGGRPGHAPA